MNDGMTTPPTAAGTKSPYCVNLKDITGQKFGRLTVLRREGKNSSEQATWRCLCECGKETVVAGSTLRAGTVVSCGCYGAEARRASVLKHGLSTTGIYRSYKEMMRRCYKPTHIDWDQYGGRKDRPIKVCLRWHTFEAFYEDMGPLWKEGLTIERRDVNGDYQKDNCHWATMKEQNNNKRNNVRYLHNGENLTSAQWAERANLSLQAFRYRKNAGWSMERILATPAYHSANYDGGKSK